MRRIQGLGIVALGFGLAALLGVTASGCHQPGGNGGGWSEKPGPKVLVSFPPLYSFAANVAGDDATVKCLLSTSGPHADSEPTASQVELARKADVFFLSGLGLDEAIADKLKGPAANPKWKTVELAEAISESALKHGEEHHEHGHEQKKADEHEHGVDPHVWLDARLAQVMVKKIAAELKTLDPAHAAGYEGRAAAYAAKLDELHKYGLGLLKDKKEKKIVSFHDSLRYFADCYGVSIFDAIQIDPGVEPAPGKMKELIQHCKKEGVRVIAVEPQFPRNTSASAILDALRQEKIDAQFVEIDPLETAEYDGLTPDLYEKTMRSNLENLAKALK
jgi:zinc transport system substrate-binding protein